MTGEKSTVEFFPKEVFSSRLRIGDNIGSVSCNINFTNMLFFGIENHDNRTLLSSKSLILPLFLMEGKNVKLPVNFLEGHFYYSPDTVFEAVDDALKCGVNKFLLFGLPSEKDEIGSQSFNENGVIQKAVRAIKERYRDEVLVITDVCMCEYTSHGHCGILNHGYVDNDKTLEYLAKIALSHAAAGADMVAPSDMMDGRVAAIRQELDKHNFINTLIMSYAVNIRHLFTDRSVMLQSPPRPLGTGSHTKWTITTKKRL